MFTDLFFDCFIGEYVMVLTTMTVNTEKENDSGDVFLIPKPLQILGFLVDADIENLYLGDTANNITKAIPRHNVVCVEISEQLTSEDEILSNFDVPTNRNSVN